MRTKVTIFIIASLMVMIAVSWAQDNKAAIIEVEKTISFKPGDPITFKVQLNEPLPKDAGFIFRISPIKINNEIVDINAFEVVDSSRKVIRFSGRLPENAMPGEWHIYVMFLKLPGTDWTSIISTNNPMFKVEGKTYPIPTKAEVIVGK